MLLSQETFDKMISFYGEPNRVLALDKLIKASKSEVKESNDLGFHQDLTKKQYSTKSVTFREKPTWIIWEKENFELSIQQFYDYNETRIILKKNKII